VRFLSARRRHPLAGLVVVLLGLFVAAGVYAALAPSSDANASNEDLVSKGHQIFLVGCATCHGLNGEGTVTSADTNYGPSLVGVGAAAVDFQVGTGRMPMAQPGTQALAKPPQYDEAEIEALAAYIASLGPGPSVPDAKYYDVSNATQEQVVNGGELFRTNCTACHNFAGSGGALPRGRFAPPILGVEPKYIYEAMVTGPQQMPVFSDGVMTPEDKRDIIAYLDHLDQQPSYGGAGLGALGATGEGLWGWVVGMTALVAAAIWIGAKGARS
jgi:ubiquinol-cytochrome c reductase cytochrome c subunit